MFDWLRVMASRIRGYFTRAGLARDFEQELDSHLALLTEENLQRGMAPADAQRAARLRLGGVAQLRETHREMRGLPWIEALDQDLRYAFRMMRKKPGFTAVVVATIALGIGAATAVFSVVDPLLFRRLPYPQDRQLVSVGYLGPVDNNEFNVVSSYFDWRQGPSPFQFLTAMRPGQECDMQVGDVPQQVHCYAVVADFLKTFGIAPVRGRDFTAEDDRPHAPTVVLLSYGFWQRAFGGDPKVLGRSIIVNEDPARVVGILPPSFEMPQLGEIDVMLPARLDPSLPRSANSSSFLRTFARLGAGVSIEQAREQMLPRFEETTNKDVPAELRSEVRLVVRSLRDRQINEVKRASWLLLGSVLALFLVACINVANLMLARAVARRQELAMRATLGAGRGRLIRQSLAESLLLGLAGGVAGGGAAWLLLRLFVNLAAGQMPRLDQARIDVRVLLFALAGSLAAALLFGVAPAMERPRAEVLLGGRTAGGGRTAFRKMLVMAQVAISLVLLAGASLLMRSLGKLENQALGFEPRHVLSASFALRHHRYRPAAAQTSFYDQLEARLERLPAGGSFALSDSIPPRGSMGRPYSNMRIFGHSPLAQNGGMVEFRWVTPGYFPAMGIRILAGRAFKEEERGAGESPVILSASLARRMLGNENPVGQQIELDGNGHWCPIVGVAADVRNNGLTDQPDPEYYRLRMRGSGEVGAYGVALFRTSLSPAVLAPWIRKEFAALDSTLPVKIESLDERVETFQERPRFVALLVGIFAALGLLLAAVGLYGVLSFLVAQQTREIGVRMALGARPRDIALEIQRRVGVWMGVGVAAGLAGSLALARAIRGLLFETSPTDPVALLAAVALLAVTAAMAAWIPSSRAARVDPAVALRNE